MPGSVRAAPALIASRRTWPISTEMSWKHWASCCIWSSVRVVSISAVTTAASDATAAFGTIFWGTFGAVFGDFFMRDLPRMQIRYGVLNRFHNRRSLFTHFYETCLLSRFLG